MASPSPVNLTQALASFDDVYSPRIVTRMNDYDVRIAHAQGEHIWHVHENTDEFFLVLAGEIEIGLRDPEERVVTLARGQVFVVPKGTFHKPSSKSGASVLLVEPAGTLTVGDVHDEVPGHVDVTTGHLV